MSTDPDYDDDGSPKYATEAEQRAARADANHALPCCPECRDGKHGNCDGTAWDNVRDRPTDCRCDHQDTPR